MVWRVSCTARLRSPSAIRHSRESSASHNDHVPRNRGCLWQRRATASLHDDRRAHLPGEVHQQSVEAPQVGAAIAVEEAAKVHTDLSRGFIRAETIAFEDLHAHGDEKGARAAGKVRQEGKTYVVKDGDILTILANV